MQPVVILTLVTYFFSQPDFSNSNNNNRVRLKKNNKWLQTKQKKKQCRTKTTPTEWTNQRRKNERTKEIEEKKMCINSTAKHSAQHSETSRSAILCIRCSYTCIFIRVEIVTCGLIFKWFNNVDEESVCVCVARSLFSSSSLTSFRFISLMNSSDFICNFVLQMWEIAMLWTIIMRHRKWKKRKREENFRANIMETN